MAHFWELPNDAALLTDKDIDRLDDIPASLKAFMNNRGIGAHCFSLSPSSPILTGKTGVIGFEQVIQRGLVANDIASSAGAEATMDDEAVIHRTVDFADALFVRDGAPGYGILSGFTPHAIPSGSASAAIQITSGLATPRKTIFAPIRPAASLCVNTAIFPTAPVTLYVSLPTAGGFHVDARAGAALGATFTFIICWHAWTALLP